MRIGQGFDVHALVPGRKLIIGGVDIPFARGLLGHSDADVLLHAVTDALLGAAGLGDIGRHFPDSDPRFKDADSRQLLRETVRLIEWAGYRVVNVDATVIARAPRMAPHVAAMAANIAADICQGCYSRVPPQTAHEVRRNNEIMTCEACGRILVYFEDRS